MSEATVRLTSTGTGANKGQSDTKTEAAGRSTVDKSNLSFTGRIANWSARHRWWVVAASVTMLVLAVLASSTFKVKVKRLSERI